MVKKYLIFFLSVSNTLLLNMNYASHWRIAVLSSSGALSKDNTFTLKVFFGIILVIVVIDSTGGGRGGGTCW